MPILFDSIKVGAATAPNRIVMAPLTRGRATRDSVPTPVMADYYGQRGDAGIILSEATGISREGLGWAHAPGLWNSEQVEAWKPVTAAVHAKGGLIYAQLWHMGRAGAPDVIGCQPISASDLQMSGKVHGYDGKIDTAKPRAATLEDITRVKNDYAQAAKNAVKAGFDGIQLHAANGYLIEQFLKASSNKRTDQYGGSVENRARFLFEILDNVIAAIGADKVAVRLSPNSTVQDCVPDDDNEELFTYVAKGVSNLNIAFLELREPRAKNDPTPMPRFDTSESPRLADKIRQVYQGLLVLNQEYSAEEAEETLKAGKADLVAFGRPFIYNPDLVTRIRQGIAWSHGDMSTWYSATGAKGYTDYPSAEGQA